VPRLLDALGRTAKHTWIMLRGYGPVPAAHPEEEAVPESLTHWLESHTRPRVAVLGVAGSGVAAA